MKDCDVELQSFLELIKEDFEIKSFIFKDL